VEKTDRGKPVRRGTLAWVAIVSAAMAACSSSEDLTGTWVRPGFDANALAKDPGSERVLVVKSSGDGGMTGKLVIPSLAGFPATVENAGDHSRVTIRVAPGMDTPLDVRVDGDRLHVKTTDLRTGDASVDTLRRASPEELAALDALMPARLPLPSVRPLPPNGLAPTPPMGWSSWNHFQTRIDDATIRGIADAMVSTGLRDAGYVYVNIDDGWQGKRDENGVLQPNERFPDMKALADYVHVKGLKLGIYTSPGPKSCAGYEGSYGHEEQDARTFAAWGIDYLKYDWCSAGLIYDDSEMPAVYQKMAEAVRATGRPMVYSICQYGRAEVWTWGAAAGGNLWRTTGDIADRWSIVAAIGFSQDAFAPFAGPGHWNDPDMLEVGNGGMSVAEYRTHMSLWALLAAPLIAGHDVRAATAETNALLTDPEVIAIDQDSLGRQGKRVSQDGTTEVWARELNGRRFAVGLFNRGEGAADVTMAAARVGLEGAYRAREVWSRKDLGPVGESVTETVAPHGVALLLLEPASDAGE